MAAENRYSQIVAWMKVILPLLALALLSTLFLFSRSPDPEMAIPFAEVDVEELAEEQRLNQPRFAGTLDDGREVLFVADRAAPVAGQPRQITAEIVQARVALSDTDYVLLASGSSHVDLEAREAELENDVRVTSSAGYRMESDRMTLALDDLRLVSPGPVRVTGPALDLTADMMSLTGEEGAQVLSFNGTVRMIYDPAD